MTMWRNKKRIAKIIFESKSVDLFEKKKFFTGDNVLLI